MTDFSGRLVAVLAALLQLIAAIVELFADK